MGTVWADKVAETTTTTGTGDLSLAGAIAGYRSFDSVMSASDTCYYMITAVDGSGVPTGDWESGIGTYAGLSVLTRSVVQESSNSNSVVSFGAGTKRVTLSKTSGAIATELRQGAQTIPLSAAALVARTTNGPSAGTSESTTNKIMTKTLDFDPATAEYAQIMVPMPKSWDNGTLSAQFIWTAGATGDVVWGCQAVALSDDDAVDTAFGSAQTVTDSVTASADVMISSYTAAVTVGGSPADGDLICVQIYRDAANGSDTLAVDAKLIAVRIQFVVNAENDS